MTQIIKPYASDHDYINDVNTNPTNLQPEQCVDCGGSHFWLNGHYDRKPEGRGKEVEVKNQDMKVLRFKCANSDCHMHYSILPSWLSPRRWYLWCFQQFVLVLFFVARVSINQIVQQTMLSRRTILRWVHWAKDKWHLFLGELLVRNTWLSVVKEVAQFYTSLFERYKLSVVMWQLHLCGIAVP